MARNDSRAITNKYPIIPTLNTMGGPRTMHPDLVAALHKYTLVYDVLQGSEQVKSRRTAYLPMPNSTDKSAENQSRYKAYLKRAVFYNVTGRTNSGFVGQIFNQDPIIELPEKMSVLGVDDGKFIPLQQVVKRAASYAVPYGRTGILVDYPTTDEVVTIEQSKYLKPIFKIYYPWDIINWYESNINNVSILTMLVLREKMLIRYTDDEFLLSYGERYRVLKLVNGEYQQDIYESNMVNGDLKFVSRVIPRDYLGNTFKSIPFVFVGSENNDVSIDEVPLYDLAEVNIAHYRNSADYEEGAFLCGQPTLVMSGLTKDWVDTVFKNQAILLGSRAAIPLPANADAKLIQAQASTMVKEAMDSKEKQMVALGAKLIERQVPRTAFETSLDKAGETSILSNIALNLSSAFEQALKLSAQFIGADTNKIKFSLTTNFEFINMSNQDRLALVTEYQSNIISWEEARHVLRRGGIASQSDDKAKKDIEENTLIVGTQEHNPAGDVKKAEENKEPTNANQA